MDEVEALVHATGRARNKHWDDPERGYESFPEHLKASLWAEARKTLQRKAAVQKDWLQNREEDPTKLSSSAGASSNGKFMYGRFTADKMY